MKEDYSLDESIPIALKRYYVVEDVNRAAEGFSQTWWPHLLRLKLKTLVDAQEFRDIIGDATTTGSVANYMSTYNREKTISDQLVAQAEVDSPKAGFNYKQYYVAPMTATSQNTAAQNRLTIAVNVRYYNNTDPEKDFEQRFSFYFDYGANEQLTGSTLDTALDEIFTRLTQDIFNASLTDW
ncbi:LPS assembly lipoprotein LptE [Mesonia mobilis]|uniref:LPS assembly lipoprotein LptE n=1 Tax=Mesonia mobilis TaxID=369791 RepID=UPI0026EF33AA|nr:LPS assembly lipoprotein LptE [Mesonia mobilis]